MQAAFGLRRLESRFLLVVEINDICILPLSVPKQKEPAIGGAGTDSGQKCEA